MFKYFRSILAVLALAVMGTMAITVAPAFAGAGGGGGTGIVAPSGFAGQYHAEQAIVQATCNFEGTNPVIFALGQLAFDRFKIQVDRQLARSGYPASPDYRQYSNASTGPYQTNCSRG